MPKPNTLIVAALMLAPAARAAPLHDLHGTWRMEIAYEVHADGRVTHNYGEHPKGLMMVDRAGAYSIQIFRPDRVRFAANDKLHATAAEYRDAVVGASTHFGTVRIDPDRQELTFAPTAASFPNWEDKPQVRVFTYRDGLLDYAVPASASADGTVAHSVWRRVR